MQGVAVEVNGEKMLNVVGNTKNTYLLVYLRNKIRIRNKM